MKELGIIRVARPCRERWAKMKGDDLVRHCDRCHKNVYDLSKLDANDARALLFEREGKLCVRFWARADGTVITRDCPISARWKTWHWAALAIMALNFVAAAALRLFARQPECATETERPAPQVIAPATKLKGFFVLPATDY